MLIPVLTWYHFPLAGHFYKKEP